MAGLYHLQISYGRQFDPNTWVTAYSENLTELTCHEMNKELLNLTIIEKERCDKQALDFASEGNVYMFYQQIYLPPQLNHIGKSPELFSKTGR